MIRIIETLSEAMSEVSKLVASNRFVSVRPAWVYNPNISDYDKQYIVEEDCITVRGVDEIIGDKPIDELKAEIIEIQRASQFQSQVVSELNKRYNATPDEINLMLFRTSTQVPRQYKSLTDYKASGEWPGNPQEKKPWAPSAAKFSSAGGEKYTDLFSIGNPVGDISNNIPPKTKTTTKSKTNKKK